MLHFFQLSPNLIDEILRIVEYLFPLENKEITFLCFDLLIKLIDKFPFPPQIYSFVPNWDELLSMFPAQVCLFLSLVHQKCDENFLDNFKIPPDQIVGLLHHVEIEASVIYCLTCLILKDKLEENDIFPVYYFLLQRIVEAKYESKLMIAFYISTVIQHFHVSTEDFFNGINELFKLFINDSSNSQLANHLCDALYSYISRYLNEYHISPPDELNFSEMIQVLDNLDDEIQNTNFQYLKNLYLN